MPTPIFLLSLLLALSEAIAAGAGLFWPGGPGPRQLTNVHGAQVNLFGQGLYANETLFMAPIQMGSDAVILFLVLPVFLITTAVWARGPGRAAYIHLGLLAVLTYHAASVALGISFNRLFLVYVTGLSVGLYALILTFVHLARRVDDARVFDAAPCRAITTFLALTGMGLLAWLTDALPATLAGTAPDLIGMSTTEVTYVLDLGILMPAAFLGAILVWHRRPLGAVIAILMMVATAVIGVMVLSQTLFQRAYGVQITMADLVIFVGVFAALGIWAGVLILRLIDALPRV